MFFRPILALALATSAALAQKPAIAPPLASVPVAYRYWPEQFVQWGSSDYPYSMMELDADTEHGKPLLDFVLTSKDGKRMHYVNDAQLMTEDKALGDDVSLARIVLERPESLGKDATFILRAVLPDNTQVQWRFVQGSDMMDRGGGITPLPTIPVPVFAYREQGAVAGEGTAISIGKQVAVAELWKEISQPPYFVAYRGALSTSAHTIVFSAGKDSWKIDAAPDAIKNGAVWKLSNAEGRTRTLSIVRMEGNRASIREVDSAFPRYSKTITATQTENGWTLESLRFVPYDDEKHAVTIAITGTDLDVIVGKKNKIASASAEIKPDASSVLFKSPDWAKGKGTRSAVGVADGSVTVVTAPAK